MYLNMNDISVYLNMSLSVKLFLMLVFVNVKILLSYTANQSLE